METIIFVAIMGAFAVGVGFGVLIMCIFAMATLGEEDLPDFASNAREYQD